MNEVLYLLFSVLIACFDLKNNRCRYFGPCGSCRAVPYLSLSDSATIPTDFYKADSGCSSNSLHTKFFFQ